MALTIIPTWYGGAPMPRKVRRLHDMEIDEVSFVDRPANQHASITFTKRADEQESAMPDIYDEEGNALDEGQLESGSVVYDDEGNEFVYLDEEDAEAFADEQGLDIDDLLGDEEFEPEYAAVGKSWSPGRSLGDQVYEDLSKALDTDERDQVLAKALDAVEYASDQAQEANERAALLEQLLAETQAIHKAEEQFSLPVDSEVIGPVLLRAQQTMSKRDYAVLERTLQAAGDAASLYDEIGFGGGAENSVQDQVEAAALELIGKNDDVSPEEAIVALYEANPAAYDEYLAEQIGR